MRPNVLFFEDYGWDTRIYEEQNKRLTKFMSTDELLILEIGSGITVPTVRYFGETALTSPSLKYQISINSGDRRGILIRINPEYYPRWMCEVKGDFEYFGLEDTPRIGSESGMFWACNKPLVEEKRRKAVVEINMGAVEGLEAIFSGLI